MPETVRAFIGLGSNLDEPMQQILDAFVELDEIPQTCLKARSSLYRSPPMGPQDQPDYINAVALLETGLDPVALLKALQAIEDLHHRIRKVRWGARTIDLDILLYGNKQFASDILTIPHPGIARRNFVLYPLMELQPDLHIPGSGKLVTLAESCPVEKLEKQIDDIPPADVGC